MGPHVRVVRGLATAMLCLAWGCRGGEDGGRPGELREPLPVQGPYLGQAPPGMMPKRFGPEAILATRDWFWHGSPEFSRDGLAMYWSMLERSGRMTLAFTESRPEGWSSPRAPAFASGDGENQPRFSSDGRSILYVSAHGAGHVLRVSRAGSGWTRPEPLELPVPRGMGMGWQFCIVADGSIYADADLGGGDGLDLFRFPWTGDRYGAPEAVSVNTEYSETAPYVTPDESLLIFASNRPGGRGRHDLWVAFKRRDGTWSRPLNLGPSINSRGEDGFPTITPDGLYLFFTSNRRGDRGYNPYWVSSRVIEDLKARADLG